MTAYPGSIYVPRVVVDRDLSQGILGDIVLAEDHNKDANEIVAAETELGLNPKGAKADVKTRLDDVDAAIATRPVIKIYDHYTAGPITQNGADIDYITKTIADIQSFNVIHAFVSVQLRKTNAGLHNYHLGWQVWVDPAWADLAASRRIGVSLENQKAFLFLNCPVGITTGFDGRVRIKLESEAGNWEYENVRMRLLLYKNVTYAAI